MNRIKEYLLNVDRIKFLWTTLLSVFILSGLLSYFFPLLETFTLLFTIFTISYFYVTLIKSRRRVRIEKNKTHDEKLLQRIVYGQAINEVEKRIQFFKPHNEGLK